MAPWPIPWIWRLIWRYDQGRRDGELAAISESTRRFVTLLKIPSQSPGAAEGLVYLLASEALSERSAVDAAELVHAVKPGAVVAQVGSGALASLRWEEEDGKERVPTNALEVIRACFVDSTRRGSFDNRAGVEVLRSIFGTTYHGPVLSARRAAKETSCAFLYLETPELARARKDHTVENVAGQMRFATISADIAVRVHTSSFQRLSSFQLHSSDSAKSVAQESSARAECPTYATSFYYLLVDLHDAYGDLPGMKKALDHARNVLFDIEQGSPVEQHDLAGAQNFRLAVEGLRIALSATNSRPDGNNRRLKRNKVVKLEDMPVEDQTHVLLAQAIQDQARTHGSVVAVVDASSIAGIHRQWNTTVSPEVKARARECFTYDFLDGDGDGNVEKKIVSSGSAVAVVGIASLPWWAPATPFALKAPAFLKLGLVQAKRNATLVLVKSIAPLLTPGKTFSAMVKSAATAGKARAAAHSVVASAERATLSAIRTAFYCLMRKKQGMSSGGRPWLVLGGSVAAGAGILWCGDRLESAIEVAPTAPSVARLGRGLDNLEKTSRSLSESHPRHSWNDLYRSLYK